jgi:ADP-ribose pyrophosphatase YjhB (NUDIX family)
MPAPLARVAARVVLIDGEDRLLLLWHGRPHDPAHWAPPGGGVEADETLREAVARELVEEVGLETVVIGRPMWLWRHRFRYDEAEVDQRETIFVSRVAHCTPRGSAAHMRADGIDRWRWWTLAELGACADELWPPQLAELVAGVLARGLDDRSPARPTAI